MEDKIDAALTCDKGCGHTVDYETCYAHQVQKVKNLLLEAQISEVKKVLPSVGIIGDVNAARTITVEELWSAMVKRKKELEADLQEMLNHE